MIGRLPFYGKNIIKFSVVHINTGGDLGKPNCTLEIGCSSASCLFFLTLSLEDSII